MTEHVSSDKERLAKLGKVLLTGSCGTIGTVLQTSLQDEFDIVGVDRIQKPVDVSTYTTDIADLGALDAVFRQNNPLDYVIHLAANADHEANWKKS